MIPNKYFRFFYLSAINSCFILFKSLLVMGRVGLFLFLFVWCFLFCFFGVGSHWRTLQRNQVGLKFTEICLPTSSFKALGLKACPTIPGLFLIRHLEENIFKQSLWFWFVFLGDDWYWAPCHLLAILTFVFCKVAYYSPLPIFLLISVITDVLLLIWPKCRKIYSYMSHILYLTFSPLMLF